MRITLARSLSILPFALAGLGQTPVWAQTPLELLIQQPAVQTTLSTLIAQVEPSTQVHSQGESGSPQSYIVKNPIRFFASAWERANPDDRKILIDLLASSKSPVAKALTTMLNSDHADTVVIADHHFPSDPAERKATTDALARTGLMTFKQGRYSVIGRGAGFYLLRVAIEEAVLDQNLEPQVEKFLNQLSTKGAEFQYVRRSSAKASRPSGSSLIHLHDVSAVPMAIARHEFEHIRFQKFTQSFRRWLKSKSWVLPFELEGTLFNPMEGYGELHLLYNEQNAYRSMNEFEANWADETIFEKLLQDYSRQVKESSIRFFINHWKSRTNSTQSIAKLYLTEIREFNRLPDEQVLSLGEDARLTQDSFKMENFVRLLSVRPSLHQVPRAQALKSAILEIQKTISSPTPHKSFEFGPGQSISEAFEGVTGKFFSGTDHERARQDLHYLFDDLAFKRIDRRTDPHGPQLVLSESLLIEALFGSQLYSYRYELAEIVATRLFPSEVPQLLKRLREELLRSDPDPANLRIVDALIVPHNLNDFEPYLKWGGAIYRDLPREKISSEGLRLRMRYFQYCPEFVIGPQWGEHGSVRLNSELRSTLVNSPQNPGTLLAVHAAASDALVAMASPDLATRKAAVFMTILNPLVALEVEARVAKDQVSTSPELRSSIQAILKIAEPGFFKTLTAWTPAATEIDNPQCLRVFAPFG